MDGAISFSRAQFIAGGVILVLVAGGAGFWLGRGTSLPVDERAAGTGTPAPGAVGKDGTAGNNAVGPRVVSFPGANAIAVNDQPPGIGVSIGLISVAQRAWVAVHEDLEGAPGKILGAKRFQPGQNQTGVVELLRPTEEGKVYYAMIHADDGDDSFDFTKDLPAADGQGNPMMMRFVATTKSAE